MQNKARQIFCAVDHIWALCNWDFEMRSPTRVVSHRLLSERGCTPTCVCETISRAQGPWPEPAIVLTVSLLSYGITAPPVHSSCPSPRKTRHALNTRRWVVVMHHVAINIFLN